MRRWSAAVWLVGALVVVGWSGEPIGRAPARPASTTSPSPASSAVQAAASSPAPGVYADPVGGACPRRDDLPPVVYTVDTKEPNVYITLDDGFHRDPGILDDLKGMNATFFVMGGALRKEPAYWQRARDMGIVFQNHTMIHPMLAKLSYPDALGQLMSGTAAQVSVVGTFPTLMRPPFGSWNEVTRHAVADAGMNALVLWSVEMIDGRPNVSRKLRPGDVILLHFNKNTRRELALLKQMMADAKVRAALLPRCV